MNGGNLEAAIEQAFASGNHQKALELLRSLAQEDSSNAAVWHRLAVIEEQVGSEADAIQAHLRCLQLGRNNPIAYLYAGYCLEKCGRLSDALPIYSLGLDLIERTVSESDLAQQAPQTIERYYAARSARQIHLQTLHQQSVGKEQACRRIYESVWVKTNPESSPTRRRPQQPHLFYIPNLPNTVGGTDNTWLRNLEQKHELVIDEFSAALDLLDSNARPYLDADVSEAAGFGDLPGSLNWTALDLFRDGVRQKTVAELFPRTLKLLGQAPLYGLNDEPFEVFFSVLKAHQKINPHYGLSNHSLTVHLPIDIPEHCQLIVDGETHNWQPGKVIVFDDTLLHAAENNSDSDRVVLIFSIWNPHLSPEERAAIQRSFKARTNWLDSRSILEPTSD